MAGGSEAQGVWRGGWLARALDYAELVRVSNLPTCASNVLVGVALGVGGGRFPWLVFTAAGVVVVVVYCGGMAMNDALDAAVDRLHRPERPIPSGRVGVRSAFVFSAACLAVGLTVAGSLGAQAMLWAGALVAAIVGYNLLHRLTAVSAAVMGAARGLVYLFSAAAVRPLEDTGVWKAALGPAAVLGCYIVGVTLTARGEPRLAGRRRGWFAALVVLAGPAAWAVVPASDWRWALAAGAVLVGWSAAAARHLVGDPPRVNLAVRGWLAGICLLDAYFLVLVGWPRAAWAAAGCFGLTVLGQRRVAGT